MDDLTELEKKWKLRLTKAELVKTVVISVFGALAVAIFYAWQANQAESHYYADLQSEREKSDVALRSEMFRTLVGAYFTPRAEDARKDAGGSKPTSGGERARQLNSIEQDIMLSDLLSRNFETIDVRPLFEDLDRRLALLHGTGDAAVVTADQKRAFLLRERLRRAAGGATARQRLLLESAGGHVFGAEIKNCPSVDASGIGGYLLTTKIFSDDNAKLELANLKANQIPVSLKGEYADYVLVKSLKDASVSIVGPMSAKSSRPDPLLFNVTYFDMPLLETVRLASGERVAFTVARYMSKSTCSRLLDDESLTPSEQEEIRERCDSLLQRCEWARLAITVLPDGFIGSRDRPYLDQLAKRQRGLDFGQAWVGQAWERLAGPKNQDQTTPAQGPP